jgi:hypothetical protein
MRAAGYSGNNDVSTHTGQLTSVSLIKLDMVQTKLRMVGYKEQRKIVKSSREVCKGYGAGNSTSINYNYDAVGRQPDISMLRTTNKLFVENQLCEFTACGSRKRAYILHAHAIPIYLRFHTPMWQNLEVNRVCSPQSGSISLSVETTLSLPRPLAGVLSALQPA